MEVGAMVVLFFFFQAEDGIRDLTVTGVQTCALPISPDQELQNGIPFCVVRSWLTGRRLVALPFSDHCDALGSDVELNWLLPHLSVLRSEERRVGKSVDLGGRRIIKKKNRAI